MTWLSLRPRSTAGVVSLAVMMAASVACGAGDGPAPNRSDGRLLVVTTVAPVTSIVASVVGDRAEVRGIVPEGADSHTFEPRPSVAAVLAGADVVFANGLGLEEPVEKLAVRTMARNAPYVELGQRTIEPGEYVYDFSFPKERGKPNPHLWTSPPLARRYAEIVKETMIRLDAAHAAVYERNARSFAAAVGELDRAMRASFATIAPERRKLVTYHDAYAYFAEHYGWTVVGAIQPSDFKDPSPKEVARLITQVRTESVPAIFGSEVFPSPVLAQIGKETGVRYVDTLRDDDLPGRPGEAEHSWLGLMRANFVTMTEALGGDASALKSLRLAPAAPDSAKYPQ